METLKHLNGEYRAFATFLVGMYGGLILWYILDCIIKVMRKDKW